MDEKTIILLLRGGHLDMSERLARGIWPHPPLQFDEVVRILTEHLRDHGAFPDSKLATSKDHPVHEGGEIRRLASGQYIYECRAPNPLNPRKVAQTVEVVFANAEGAARCYLKWDLHLPGDLDGWKVIG
jgi:hypothetical protein